MLLQHGRFLQQLDHFAPNQFVKLILSPYGNIMTLNNPYFIAFSPVFMKKQDKIFAIFPQLCRS